MHLAGSIAGLRLGLGKRLPEKLLLPLALGALKVKSSHMSLLLCLERLLSSVQLLHDVTDFMLHACNLLIQVILFLRKLRDGAAILVNDPVQRFHLRRRRFDLLLQSLFLLPDVSVFVLNNLVLLREAFLFLPALGEQVLVRPLQPCYLVASAFGVFFGIVASVSLLAACFSCVMMILHFARQRRRMRLAQHEEVRLEAR